MERGECDLMTSAMAARELGVTPDRIRQLARAGQLRSIRMQTGQRIFLVADVEHLKLERDRSSKRTVGNAAHHNSERDRDRDVL